MGGPGGRPHYGEQGAKEGGEEMRDGVEKLVFGAAGCGSESGQGDGEGTSGEIGDGTTDAELDLDRDGLLRGR